MLSVINEFALGAFVPAPLPRAAPMLSQQRAAVAMAFDPFADPNFGALTAQTTNHIARDPGYGPALTGLIIYGLTMLFLTYWDTHVLPDMQERGSMPRIPGEQPRLTSTDRKVPYLTPVTVDRSVPLPSASRLEKTCHRVGRTGSVHQYICASKNTDFDDGYGECVQSPEFTDMYGRPVWICKRKVLP